MKNILKSLLICAMMILIVTYAAQADEMANDDFVAVSSGYSHTLALRNNGDLWAFGANNVGQVGNSGASDSVGRGNDAIPCQYEPVLVLENVVDMAAGMERSLAVTEDGVLWGWGIIYPTGWADPALEPQKIMDNITACATNFDFSLALDAEGVLWAWGNNDKGQLGDGTADSTNEPVQIMENVTAMAAGFGHALAVQEDGSLWAWGLNQQGQVGIGVVDEGAHMYQLMPTQIFESGVVAVAAGTNTSLAIMEDGALWGWGSNLDNSMLETDEDIIAAPQLLMEGVQLAEGGLGNTLAIKEDNTLWGWGNNLKQALNFNYKEDYVSAVPHQIMSQVVDVSSIYLHTMAVKQDGTLWGWGDNSLGQLAQEPGQVGLPVRVSVEYPADAPEPEEEPAEDVTADAEDEPLPAEPDRPNPLPFIIGCGVIGAGGVTAGLVWQHKKKAGGVSKWKG